MAARHSKQNRQHRWQKAIQQSGLNPTVRHVGLSLSTWARSDGTLHTPPSVKTLAKDTGRHLDTVRRAIATMVEHNYLAHVGLHPRWKTNVYVLVIPVDNPQYEDTPTPVENAPTPPPAASPPLAPQGGYPSHHKGTHLTDADEVTGAVVVDIVARNLGRHLA